MKILYRFPDRPGVMSGRIGGPWCYRVLVRNFPLLLRWGEWSVGVLPRFVSADLHIIALSCDPGGAGACLEDLFFLPVLIESLILTSAIFSGIMIILPVLRLSGVHAHLLVIHGVIIAGN